MKIQNPLKVKRRRRDFSARTLLTETILIFQTKRDIFDGKLFFYEKTQTAAVEGMEVEDVRVGGCQNRRKFKQLTSEAPIYERVHLNII